MGSRVKIIGVSGKLGTGKDTVATLWQFITDGLHAENAVERYLEGCEPYDPTWRIKMYAGKIKFMAAAITGCSPKDFEDQEFKNQKIPFGFIERMDVNNLLHPMDGYDDLNEAMHMGWKVDDTGKNMFKREREPITYRRLLQLLGHDFGRVVLGEDTWVNSLFLDIGPKDRVIITDVRYPNEAVRIRKEGGLLIRVDRRLENRFPKEYRSFLDIEDDDLTFESYLFDHLKQREKLTHASETSLDDFGDWDYVIDNDASLEVLAQAIEDIVNTNLIPVGSTLKN